MYRVFVNDDSVPDSEFDDVCRLLEEHSIHFIERPRLIGSLFRFGSKGAGCDLMVHNESDFERARQLIGDYQSELLAQSRARYTEQAGEPGRRMREIFGWLLAASVVLTVLALSIGIGFR